MKITPEILDKAKSRLKEDDDLKRIPQQGLYIRLCASFLLDYAKQNTDIFSIELDSSSESRDLHDLLYKGIYSWREEISDQFSALDEEAAQRFQNCKYPPEVIREAANIDQKEDFLSSLAVGYAQSFINVAAAMSLVEQSRK